MRSFPVELVKPLALALHMRLQVLFRQSGRPAPPLERLMFVATPANSGASGWYQRTSAPLDSVSADAPATSSVYPGGYSDLVAAMHASCATEAGSYTTWLLLTSSRGVAVAFSSQNTRGFCSSAAQRVGYTVFRNVQRCTLYFDAFMCKLNSVQTRYLNNTMLHNRVLYS